MVLYLKDGSPILDGDTLLERTSIYQKVDVADSNVSEYTDHIHPQITDVYANEYVERTKSKMLSKLWATCNKYQIDRIEALGVFRLYLKYTQFPETSTKALAICDWVDQLWALYYKKRARLFNTPLGFPMWEEVDGFRRELYDFGQMGNIPFDFFEAMQE